MFLSFGSFTRGHIVIDQTEKWNYGSSGCYISRPGQVLDKPG